jgi:hemerythrin-like metal-binding protein
MPLPRWTSRFETGIAVVDAQHRELFSDLHHLHATLRKRQAGAALQEELATLCQRTVKHFQTEEQLMKEAAYPGRVAHAEQHHDLLLKVRELQYLCAKGQAMDAEVSDFLAGWFSHHILESDRDYAGHLRTARDA